MAQSLSQKYRTVIIKDVLSPHYPRQLRMVKGTLAIAWAVLFIVYCTLIHPSLRTSTIRINQILVMYEKTPHPMTGFFIYLGATLGALALFFLLVVVFLCFSFFAYDIAQRNQLIVETRSDRGE